MKNDLLSYLSKISLVIFAFLLLYYFVQGATSKVLEGDSVAYHIPISQLILAGKIYNPALAPFSPLIDRGTIYSPGTSEMILAIFTMLHIPINLFDWVGIILLFFVVRHLAKTYGFSNDYSTIFSSTIASLHVIIRWLLSQTIDVWLACFFVITLILLRNPKKTWRYFLSLGVAMGMFFGSKYSAPIFSVFLLVVLGKPVLKSLNLRRLIVFLIPFSILGLSWYVRNYILTGNPYYPTNSLFLHLKGYQNDWTIFPVWRSIIVWSGGYKVWINAFVSEYTVWCLAFLAVPIIFSLTLKRLNKNLRNDITKLLLIAYPCFFAYLFFPSGFYPNLVTSGFRYTYSPMILLIIVIFIFAKRFAKEEVLGIIAVTNMLIMPELSYHPKILMALIPVAFAIFYPSKIVKFYQFAKKIFIKT